MVNLKDSGYKDKVMKCKGKFYDKEFSVKTK